MHVFFSRSFSVGKGLALRCWSRTVNELLNARQIQKDPQAVISFITAERLRRFSQMVRDLCSDLEHDGLAWPAQGVQSVQESLNLLRERLGKLDWKPQNSEMRKRYYEAELSDRREALATLEGKPLAGLPEAVELTPDRSVGEEQVDSATGQPRFDGSSSFVLETEHWNLSITEVTEEIWDTRREEEGSREGCARAGLL